MQEQRQNLIHYIIPALFGNISMFILTIVDGMFVGNGIGIDALGAVSLAMPYIMLVSAFSVLFNIGGVTVAAVRFGRKDNEGANVAFMHALSINALIFSVISILGIVFSEKIAGYLGANSTYLAMVSDYIRWYSVFLLPSTLFYCFNTFARNDSSPNIAMFTSIICTAVNIFGDWLLVYPLAKGVAGAAFATGFSNLIGFFVALTHFVLKKGNLRIKRFKINFSLYTKIMLRGFPEMIAQFANPITTFFMNRMLITYLGNMSVNAFSVICYAASLFASLMYGLAGGLQPLYGQSYGAKDDKSLRYYFRSGQIFALVGGLAIFALTFVLGKPICMLFGAKEEAIGIVEASLPKYCLNYVFAASSSVIGAYLFSTKRTPYAIALNICRSFVFNSLCINILPRLFGYDFVWYTVAVAEGICLVIALALKNVSERNGIVYR